MANTINSLNAMALTINKLGESNAQMCELLNNVARAVNLKTRVDVSTPETISPIMISRAAGFKNHIDVVSKRILKILGEGGGDKEAVSEVLHEELLESKYTPDMLFGLAKNVASVNRGTKKVNNALSESIEKSEDYMGQIANILTIVSDNQAKIDGAMTHIDGVISLANESIGSSNKVIDKYTELSLHVEQSIAELQKVTEMFSVDAKDVTDKIDSLEKQINILDNNTLNKTNVVKDDIVKAVKEIRRYMKPMTDRISRLENKIESVGCSDVSIPDTKFKTISSRNRRT